MSLRLRHSGQIDARREDDGFHCQVQPVLLPYAVGQKAAYLNHIDRTVPNWREAYY